MRSKCWLWQCLVNVHYRSEVNRTVKVCRLSATHAQQPLSLLKWWKWEDGKNKKGASFCLAAGNFAATSGCHIFPVPIGVFLWGWQWKLVPHNTVPQHPYPHLLSTTWQYRSPPQMWRYYCKARNQETFPFPLFLPKTFQYLWGKYKMKAGFGLLVSP